MLREALLHPIGLAMLAHLVYLSQNFEQLKVLRLRTLLLCHELILGKEDMVF